MVSVGRFPIVVKESCRAVAPRGVGRYGRGTMARLRKTARLWSKPKSREEAGRAWIESDPRLFAIYPPAIFGRSAPLEIEIGAGKGEFIIESAREFPARDFLAVELSATVARILAVRCGRAGLANLRVARMDARTLVNLMLPEASVAAFHIYFPDPWPKERHIKHRLFTPRFAAGIMRTLEPDGIVSIATDVQGYAAAIFPMMEAAGLARINAGAPGAARTGFARKYAAAGKRVFAASFRRP
jgi:tRNA (guanine-N7-)-methyltransferase